jgi:hypothetical protein
MSTHDVHVSRRAGSPLAASETAYGRIVAGVDVELALLELIQTWLPDYLAEVCRQRERAPDDLPTPRAWVVSSDVEKMPEDQTPAVIVASPGMTDAPRADGLGSYVARWRIGIAVHLSARGNALSLRLVRLYIAAVRALVVQQQALDGLDLRRIDWLDERYDTLPSIDDRTVCTALVELAVEVADVTTRHAGPLAPILPATPNGETPSTTSPTWPSAELVEVAITKDPLAGGDDAATRH